MTLLDPAAVLDQEPPERRRDWLSNNRRHHPRSWYWCTWCGFDSQDDTRFPSPARSLDISVVPVLCATCYEGRQAGEMPNARTFWQIGYRIGSQPDRAQALEVARLWGETFLLFRKPHFPIPGYEGPVGGGREIKAKTWISIELVEKLDKNHPLAKRLVAEGKPAERPAANRYYEITTPNGEVVTGYLDGGGRARVNNIDPGTCKVRFPKIDPKRWKRA